MTTVPLLSIMPIKKMCQQVRESTNKDIAVLVATSYETDHIQYPSNSHTEVFDDIDYECLGRSITSEQASNYAEFVRNLPTSTKMIICACNAGESRSAALCASLCEYFGVDSRWIWDSPQYHPNMFVFDMFTQALGIEIDDTKKDDLYWRNRQAFSNAIRQARGEKAIGNS